MIKLESVTNGVIMTDSEGRKHIFACEGEENNPQDADNVQALMYAIMDELGFMYGKYNQFAVRIEVKHGYDYECPTPKKCNICNEDVI